MFTDTFMNVPDLIRKLSLISRADPDTNIHKEWVMSCMFIIIQCVLVLNIYLDNPLLEILDLPLECIHLDIWIT